MKIAIIATHPIQYYSPWFRHLAEGRAVESGRREAGRKQEGFNFEVFYAHRQTAKGQAEAGFGVEFEWDVPVLEGYPYRFLKNVSKRPGLEWFGGCDSPEIGEILVREGFTHVLLIGWHKKVFWQAFWAAKKAGIKVLSRGDSQLGMQSSWVKRWIKEIAYRPMLRAFDAHLYVGQRNFAYLRHYGVPKDRLFFSPHFVDNQWWGANAERSRAGGNRREVERGQKAESGRRKAEKSVEFLFAGKFIPKKRVMDLLEAAAGVPEARVVLVGDGPLRSQLEERAKQNDLMEEVGRSPFAERAGLREGGELCHREGGRISRVLFAGFRNQGQLPAYLAGAGCLVLPSDGTETWGLIVNEAMACGTPAIVSTACGCEPDLIVDGQTGYSFTLGDTQALADRLGEFIRNQDRDWSPAVRKKIAQYTMIKATSGLLHAIGVGQQLAEGVQPTDLVP
jgi:glycosyltransferase involved in cell wall biosynthesis